MKVKTVLVIEGLTDIALMILKFSVGIATNSSAIISDALHSLTDLANNVIAFVAIRISERPSDENHHYGHRKFEHLAVFSLAVLLMVVALELVLNAIRNFGQPVEQSHTGLVLMITALGFNVSLTLWEHYWARRLNSDLLTADAKHTLSDVLTTIAVIGGWQFATLGYLWIDTLMAIIVAIIVVVLAVQLLTRAIPILVDQSEFSPQAIATEVQKLGTIESVGQVRARDTCDGNYADITISVDPQTSTLDAHEVTEKIEQLMTDKFGISDVIVHVEPSHASDNKDRRLD